MTATTKHPGIVFHLNGRELVLPAATPTEAFVAYGEIMKLSADVLDAHQRGDVVAEATKTLELLEREMAFIGTALRRNHPDVSDEALEELEPLEVSRLFGQVCALTARSGGLKFSGRA